MGASQANEIIYRIFLTANNSSSLSNLDADFGEILLYPVPTSGSINVDFQIKNPMQISSALFDINNMKIREFPLHNLDQVNQRIELGTENISNGFYYLEIKSEKAIIRKKVQIIH